MPAVATKDIIAIGGSAGSGAVLKGLVGRLPHDLPASVFVSTHLPARSPGFLSEVLSTSATLPVARPWTASPSSAAVSTWLRPTVICC